MIDNHSFIIPVSIYRYPLQDFANEHDIPYIETSAKDGTMVTELFEKVLTDIINPSEKVKQRQWRPFTSADLNSCKSCKCAIS